MSARALISLSGGGDRQLYWVDPAVLAWIEQYETFPQRASSMNIRPPQNVVEFLRAASQGDSDREEAFQYMVDNGVHVTTGSCDNDKALLISPMVESYSTMKQAMAAAKTNGWDMDGEYDGCIY